MPYTYKKTGDKYTVYKKSTGKKVGSTKGTKKALNKYLAALHAAEPMEQKFSLLTLLKELLFEKTTRSTPKGGKGSLKRKLTKAGITGPLTIAKLMKFKGRENATPHDKAQANMVINFMRAKKKKS